MSFLRKGSTTEQATAEQWAETPTRYLVALVAVLIMLGVRVALDAPLGNSMPMLLLTVSVVAAGWYGGLGPALLATFLTTVSGWYLFIPPRYSMAFAKDEGGLRIGLYLLVCVVMSLLCGQARRTLRRSRQAESLFRRTLLDAPVPMVVHSEDGRIVALSQAWTVITGYAHADIPTVQAWTEKAYGERSGPMLTRIRGLYAATEPADSGEEVIRTASGETRTWRFRSSPIGRDERGCRLVLSVVHDATDRNRHEAERAAAHAKLQATIDSITDGLLVLDRNWRCTYFSETGARMLGLRTEDLVGGDIWHMFPDAVHRKFYSEYHRALEINQPVHFEEFYPEPLNLWLECHCYPSPEGLSVYFRDITERKRVEENLRQRTAELDSLLENAPIGFAFFDRELRYLRLNERLAELNGEPVAAHLGVPVLDLPPFGPAIHPALERVFSTSEPVQVAFSGEIPKEPGVARFWLAGLYPVSGPDGQVSMVGAFVVDNTEQRRAEQTIRDSEERLRLALESAQMGTFDIAVAENKLIWDDNSRALFSFPSGQEVPFEIALSRVHRDDRSRIRSAIRDAYTAGSGGVYHVEYRLMLPDGTARWVVSRGRVHFDGSGPSAKPQRLIGVNQDVTDRKQAELALAESEERFRIAAGAAELGLFEWDISADRAFWHNARMYEIFRRSREQGPLSNAAFVENCLHPADVPVFTESLLAAMNSVGPLRIDTRIRDGSGEERWVKFEGAFRRAADGSPLRLLAIAQDITETRRMEQALRHKEAYLRAIYDRLPVGVVTADPQGRVLSINQAGLRLHGFNSVDQMPADPEQYRADFDMLSSDGSRLPLEEWPTERASRGDYVSDCEVILRRVQTGREAVLSYTAVPLAEDGQLSIFVIQDITERHQAERRIRASETQYRTLFESIDEGFCVIEVIFDEQERPVDYLFLETNPAFERHTGIVNAVGLHVRQLIPNLDQSWFDIYGTVALTGEAVRFENDSPAMNRSFDVYAFRVGVPKQRRVAVLFNDITGRRRSEAEMAGARREAESQRRLLDAVLDSLPVGVIIGDSAGKLLRWNRANETLWGLRGVDPANTANIGEFRKWKGWWPDTGRRIEPEEWAMARALLNREVAAGELVEIERFDGTGRRFVVNMGAPVFDADGSVIAAVVAQMDVTDRVSMERALRDSEDKFRTISEHIPQLAWMADERGWNLWYNQRWFEYTGMTPEDMQQRYASGADETRQDIRYVGVVHPEDWPSVRQRWEHSLTTGEPFETEFRSRRADGDYRWFLGRALAIRDADGRIVRWFGTNTDIHEQKVTEGALRRSNEDLQQFAYVASHDLQEPLRTVVSFSEMLSRKYAGQLDQEAGEYLAYVVEAANRMSNLVRDLLLYSRATRDGQRAARRVVLDDVLEDALRSLHTSMEETGTKIFRSPLPAVQGDRMQLGQVLQNLVSNALKYGKPGVPPEVEIRSERQRGEWLISVRDNGQGFEQQFAERIFGIFKRLHGRHVPGTGIGLAICKRVIERHGGRIWAESSKDHGATFFFTLPIAEEMPAD